VTGDDDDVAPSNEIGVCRSPSGHRVGNATSCDLTSGRAMDCFLLLVVVDLFLPPPLHTSVDAVTDYDSLPAMDPFNIRRFSRVFL